MAQRKNVIIRFNHRTGFRALRTEPGVIADLQERAERIAEAAGEGVEVLPMQQPYSRAHFVIAPTSEEAARRVAKDNTLLRALEAGRG